MQKEEGKSGNKDGVIEIGDAVALIRSLKKGLGDAYQERKPSQLFIYAQIR